MHQGPADFYFNIWERSSYYENNKNQIVTVWKNRVEHSSLIGRAETFEFYGVKLDAVSEHDT